MKELPRRFVVVVCIVLLCWPRDVHGLCVNCHLPADAPDEKIEELFMIDFKRRVMEKLNMKTEPKASSIEELPTPIIQAIAGPDLAAGDEAEEENKDDNNIKDIVLTPFQTDSKFKSGVCSVKYRVSNNQVKSSYKVASVKLWFNPKHDSPKKQWFQIYEVTKGNRNLILNDTVSVFTRKWRELKFVPSRDWSATPWKTLKIEVVGINNDGGESICQKDLLLQLHLERAKRRVRRQTTKITRTEDCSLDDNCCKYKFRLNLKKFMPWVELPSTITARVCKGVCPTLHRTRFTWTWVVGQHLKKKPCCVPTKFSPISIVYHEKKSVLHSTLDDILVESCGCA